MVGAGASLGFWMGDAVVDMIWGCWWAWRLVAVAFAFEVEKGHMVEDRCVVCD